MGRSFLQSGNCETAKGVYHATLGALALGALAYNLAALWIRPAKHLGVNVVVYGAIVGLEARKVIHHRRAVQ